MEWMDGQVVVDGVHAAEALRLLRRGEDVRVPGAGHNAHRDKFNAIITAVAPFLSKDSNDGASASPRGSGHDLGAGQITRLF